MITLCVFTVKIISSSTTSTHCGEHEAPSRWSIHYSTSHCDIVLLNPRQAPPTHLLSQLPIQSRHFLALHILHQPNLSKPRLSLSRAPSKPITTHLKPISRRTHPQSPTHPLAENRIHQNHAPFSSSPPNLIQRISDPTSTDIGDDDYDEA